MLYVQVSRLKTTILPLCIPSRLSQAPREINVSSDTETNGVITTTMFDVPGVCSLQSHYLTSSHDSSKITVLMIPWKENKRLIDPSASCCESSRDSLRDDSAHQELGSGSRHGPEKHGGRRAEVVHKHGGFSPQPGICVKSQVLINAICSQMYSARNEAVSRVVDECQKRQGNAIIAMRFDAADLAGFVQVCAYGTAALVEKVDENAADVPQLVRTS